MSGRRIDARVADGRERDPPPGEEGERAEEVRERAPEAVELPYEELVESARLGVRHRVHNGLWVVDGDH